MTMCPSLARLECRLVAEDRLRAQVAPPHVAGSVERDALLRCLHDARSDLDADLHARARVEGHDRVRLPQALEPEAGLRFVLHPVEVVEVVAPDAERHGTTPVGLDQAQLLAAVDRGEASVAERVRPNSS